MKRKQKANKSKNKGLFKLVFKNNAKYLNTKRES